MSKLYWSGLIRICVVVVLAMHGQPGGAQQMKRRVAGGDEDRSKGGADILRIRKLEGGRGDLVKTPEYRTNVARGTKPIRKWARIRVTYGTEPEWIDELTFRFYALTLKTEGGKKFYSLFKTAVRYVDIEQGRRHESTTFLRPAALKRYGDVVAVGVEIIHEGKIVAEDSDESMSMPKGAMWWKNPMVIESKAVEVVVRDGYLLDRSQSPFTLINIDDYQVIE